MQHQICRYVLKNKPVCFELIVILVLNGSSPPGILYYTIIIDTLVRAMHSSTF